MSHLSLFWGVTVGVSQSAMKKCFVIMLYKKKSIFCNVCGVVLLKSVSCVCVRVCKEWELQDVLRLMSHCVAAVTLFI